MSIRNTETILHLAASSLPDLQGNTSLHDTASSLHVSCVKCVKCHCAAIFITYSNAYPYNMAVKLMELMHDFGRILWCVEQSSSDPKGKH